MLAICAVATLLLAASSALADFAGRVVKVADGDTLTVLVNKKQIACAWTRSTRPRLKQAFGQRSRQSLADICAGKTAEVAEQGKGRSKRTLDRVTCAGVDANAEQVRRGLVLSYNEPTTEISVVDRQIASLPTIRDG